MAKKTFKPILGDLANLSKEEQAAYVLAVCSFLDVPAELGLVDLILLDSGDGQRKLTLYVKKGATDIIRENRSISIDELQESNGDGYVGWKVKGHNKDGRTEMAAAAVSIKGMSPQQAADRVAFAQTKAMRRLTLQFAGGGFLDESEIHETTTSIAEASAGAFKAAAKAAAAPSAAIGKDITPPPVEADMGSTLQSVVPPETKKPRKKRTRKTATLDSPDSTPESTPASKPAPSEAEPPSESATVPEPPTTVFTVPDHVGVNVEVQENMTVTVAAPKKKKEEPVVIGTPVTPEQKDAFRKLLADWSNRKLAENGFLQSTKLGSRARKLGMFIKLMFPAASTEALSFEQWTHFFKFMDTKEAEVGLAGLAEFINEKIGETKEGTSV